MISSLSLQLSKMKVVFLLFTILSITNAQANIDAELVEKFLKAGLNRAAMAMRTGEEPLWQLDPTLVTNFTFTEEVLEYEFCLISPLIIFFTLRNFSKQF